MLRAYFDGKKPVKKSTGNQLDTTDEDDEGESLPSLKEPQTSVDAAND
jgi:hypothetical protein